MSDEKQDRFFDFLESMIDRAFNLETRLQKVEFKETIIWWLGAAVVSIGTSMLVYFLQKLI